MVRTKLADDVERLGVESKSVQVQVSYEVIKLFSEQLYASPIKAVEELVVNSWDAGAKVCSVLVDLEGDRPLIAVFDDGKGMTLQELENLWHIGISNKPRVASPRKQIGKFGIGKLASYAVARRATYVSKTLEGIHAVSIDFQVFADATDAAGVARPVNLILRQIPDLDALLKSPAFDAAANVLATSPAPQILANIPTWTLVVLEDLKEKAQQLRTGRLRWVLETAMPLERDFQLYLNGSPVQSSKEQFGKRVHFKVSELEVDRLHDLGAVTGEEWTVNGDILSCPSFPSGITGEAFVTRESLYAQGGKSEDLGRSHGFFVRVHNRLINETDPLFGARPLSFATWNRFAAVVEVPDLNRYVTASRDDVEQTDMKAKLRQLLLALFNQARDQHEELIDEEEKKNKQRKEGARDYVSTELVERPLADALVSNAARADDLTSPGAQLQASWRFVEPVEDVVELQKLVDNLYTVNRKDRRYIFKYSASGPLASLARLDVRTSTFVINEDHQLVREFAEKPESKRLLEAMVVAEALLEVYLHAARVEPEIVDDLLDRRDTLLRSLALDQSYSLKALASALRDSTQNANDLEIALVGALRALGFSARHIGGSGTPDGLAQYVIHGSEEKAFTLEAKSSADVPSLPQLDFAGLQSHYRKVNANGCLLVAPSYPNANDPEGEVSRRARLQGVSCWTIEQLAVVVESAERRHINARKLQEIVLVQYTPADVSREVSRLLSQPTFDKTELYAAILEALASLENRLRGTPRNVLLLATEISRQDRFKDIDTPEIRDAVTDLARASSGMLHIADDNNVFVLGALEELGRRVSAITGQSAPPRRNGTFRQGPD
jgi:Histidine kinase-, DNA gyrase B-, and HSP90-like ATPase